MLRHFFTTRHFWGWYSLNTIGLARKLSSVRHPADLLTDVLHVHSAPKTPHFCACSWQRIRSVYAEKMRILNKEKYLHTVHIWTCYAILLWACVCSMDMTCRHIKYIFVHTYLHVACKCGLILSSVICIPWLG